MTNSATRARSLCPVQGASLVQVEVSNKASKKHDLQKIDVIMSALHGKTAGFEKVIKFIENMVKFLDEEQLDDDHKKYCELQFYFTDDKKQELERSVSEL